MVGEKLPLWQCRSCSAILRQSSVTGEHAYCPRCCCLREWDHPQGMPATPRLVAERNIEGVQGAGASNSRKLDSPAYARHLRQEGRGRRARPNFIERLQQAEPLAGPHPFSVSYRSVEPRKEGA